MLAYRSYFEVGTHERVGVDAEKKIMYKSWTRPSHLTSLCRSRSCWIIVCVFALVIQRKPVRLRNTLYTHTDTSRAVASIILSRPSCRIIYPNHWHEVVLLLCWTYIARWLHFRCAELNRGSRTHWHSRFISCCTRTLSALYIKWNDADLLVDLQ